MSNFIKLLVVGSIFALSNLANGADWQFIFQDNENTKYYIDFDSISEYYDDEYGLPIATFWVQSHYKKDQALTNSKSYRSSKTHYHLSCDSRIMTASNMVAYDRRNKVTYSGYLESEWEPIVPDTLGESFFETVCEYP